MVKGKPRIYWHCSVVYVIILASLVTNCSKPKRAVTASSPEILIEKFIQLGQQYDPSIVDLYSDEAKIQNRQVDSAGNSEIRTMKSSDYKKIISAAMPLGKLIKDSSTYTNIVFTKVNGRVMVTADQYSNLGKYKTPIFWVLEKDDDSNWLIVEEISESRQ